MGKDWKTVYESQIGWIPEYWKNNLLMEHIINKQFDPFVFALGDTPAAQMRWFELTHRLPEYHLTRVDRLSMAHSLEARIPFLRKKVIQWALAQSADILINEKPPKNILREAFNDLPLTILKRKKQPFTSPIGTWMNTILKNEVKDLLLYSNKNICNTLGLKKQGLKTLVDSYYGGNSETLNVLWGVYMLFKWHTIAQSNYKNYIKD